MIHFLPLISAIIGLIIVILSRPKKTDFLSEMILAFIELIAFSIVDLLVWMSIYLIIHPNENLLVSLYNVFSIAPIFFVVNIFEFVLFYWAFHKMKFTYLRYIFESRTKTFETKSSLSELRDKQISLRNKFYELSKSRNTNLENEAIKLSREYSKLKKGVFADYYHEFINLKVNGALEKEMAAFDLDGEKIIADSQLNLSTSFRHKYFITFIVISIFTFIVAMYALLNFLLLPLFFLILFIVVTYKSLRDMSKDYYRNIGNNNSHSHEEETSFLVLDNMFKDIRRDNMYKNGKPKWNNYKHGISKFYKEFIVDMLDNPYDIDLEPKPLTGKAFLTSGGVYAWIISGEIRYIGRTNNFSNRMKQHEASFYNGAPELKYNTGLRPSDVDIKILAITDDVDEQSVLESYFFEKYKYNDLLNSVSTLTWEKILKRENYRRAWERIHKKTIKKNNS